MNLDLLDRHSDKFTTGKPGECWLWHASKCKDGYPVITSNKSRFLRQVMADEILDFAHRHNLHHRKVCVRHRCDEPSCCNPAHLTVGTQSENVRDRQSRKRQAKGERSGASKLTADQVVIARSGYRRGATFTELAQKAGVTPATIRCAIRGITWHHIPGAVAA